MIFCDMGVNPTNWGFSAYDEVAAKAYHAGLVRTTINAVDNGIVFPTVPAGTLTTVPPAPHAANKSKIAQSNAGAKTWEKVSSGPRPYRASSSRK